MILRDAELMGWIICGKQGTEYAVKLPPAYVINDPDFHGDSETE